MKKKENLKILLLLLLGIIISSCVDDYDLNENNRTQSVKTRDFKTTKITLNDVDQYSIAFSKLTNPKKDKSLSKVNHKIINDTINNFSIDTEIGTFIESGNYHSYTFKVIRPNGSVYLLENLVVSKEGTNEYETYLYQYDITIQELQMLKEGLNINLLDKISRVTIENTNILTNLNAKEFPCFVQVTSYVAATTCTGSEHHNYGDSECLLTGWNAASPAHYITESVLSTCNDNSGGGGGGEGNPSDPSQTTGSGGGPRTTVTTPTVCVKDCIEYIYEEGESPCDKIKSNTNNSAYKQKFKALTNNYGLSHETGFGQVGSSLIDGTNNNNHQIIYPDNSKNGTHVHNNSIKTKSDGTTYDENVKMLSPLDIYLVMFAFRPNNTDPLDTFHVMASNEGIFAINIIDSSPFTAVQRDFLFKWKKRFEDEAKEIISIWNTENARKNALQKMFLQGLKDAGLENKIALFEGEIENENDPDINNFNIKWSRKTIKKTWANTLIETEPCN
ncbi:hypothetical protein FLGE108171_15875 [Flavobacterium gelidilacus]|uniref:hypothetical protein n=1 Tax=Flavobacterium gelidilacus TaxID=206041 RepID=UPI000411DD62|nr:hypothetical protein [Flavobacterium gelidilacus]